MSEGEMLAKALWEQMTADQRDYAHRLTEDELGFFLAGLFWGQHSRVALANAAGHLYAITRS